MDGFEEWIASTSTTMWTWLVLPLVGGLGVYFTVRTGVVQVRMLPRMISSLTDRTPTDADGRPQSLSAFQAFTVSAASRVGIGNIAGVATAIALGGPGAVLWMWAMAILGAATSFVESTLGQLYKVRDAEGFRGGPAYYIEHGLRSRPMGIVVAIVLIVAAPFAVTSLQSFTITETVTGQVGTSEPWLVWTVALVVTGLVAAVVLGGIRRIATFTQAIVPAMAVLYLVLGLIIMGINAAEIPAVLEEIVADAFGWREVAGGAVGTAILVGVQRGMFSNEAGFGTAPNAAASAATTHPVKQGLVQSLGVYFDTLVVCSVTAFIVLTTHPDLSDASAGIALTQEAVVGTLGAWSGPVFALIVFLLAFSTILGLYFYGAANVEYITTRPAALRVYQVIALAFVLGGAVASASLVWTLADALLGVLAILNLVAIGLLSRHVFALLRDYSEQRREGRDPVFTRERLPSATGVLTWEDEATVTGSPPPASPAPAAETQP
ncbi:sodium:alanine symporter family protein [Demequina sp. NBRC 110056]|uniref:alanine/glycine:cation symporter family protein n=1 Tax=Demequina sp. NBRC 110056 TaxID=1570345 RepID=UPI000A014071|nr:alanine/glycine:cation symporter family protein [Demequina sp. NBRC 110056]